MTENEAIKEIKYWLNVYAGSRIAPEMVQATGMAIKALEEVQQYREIGTPEECQTAVEKQNANKELESHDEKHILECCISLMQEMVNEFAEWYRWQLGVDSSEEIEFDWSDEE